MGFDSTEHAASTGNDIVEDPAVFATNLRLDRAPVGVPPGLEAGFERVPAAGDITPHIGSAGLNLCPNPVFAGYAFFNAIPAL